MSSEIRAGDNRTYWIISNGNSYVDGVTDPTLVTTVGNGWHIYWIGSDYSEYLTSCNNCNIIPRNTDPNTPSVSNNYPKVSARQVRLWLIQNGISLQAVYDAINAIEDPSLRDSVAVEWEYAPYIERSHPMLIPLAMGLGLTENDVDRAFAEANSI
ncbi:hypothetical protein EBT16_00070 [bacterium]|nr:hypothetical protein [bacterium]